MKRKQPCNRVTEKKVSKNANTVPDGETRSRGQMILQHAAWYLLSHYPKLEEWKTWGVIREVYIKNFQGKSWGN